MLQWGRRLGRVRATALGATVALVASLGVGVATAGAASAAEPNAISLSIFADGSAVGGGSGGYAAGHAFMSAKNLTSAPITIGRLSVPAGKTITFGTWGNKDEHAGLWYNLEAKFISDNPGVYATKSLSTDITSSQVGTLNRAINGHDKYLLALPLDTCASFAVDVWDRVAPKRQRVAQTAVPALLFQNIDRLGGVDAAAVDIPFDPSQVWFGNGSKKPILSVAFNPPSNIQSLAIATQALPGAILGQAYSYQLASSGGLAPYSWRLSQGKLPKGLRLTSKGALSGTPTAPGLYTINFQVRDANRAVATAAISLTIGKPEDASSTGFGYIVDPASTYAGGDVRVHSNRSCPAGSTAYGSVASDPNGLLWWPTPWAMVTAADGSWSDGFQTGRQAGNVAKNTAPMQAFSVIFSAECRASNGEVLAAYPTTKISYDQGLSVSASYDATSNVMILKPDAPCPVWADTVSASVSTSSSDFTPTATALPIKAGAWTEISVSASKLRQPIDGDISVSCTSTTSPDRSFLYTGSDTTAWRASFS